MHAERVVADAEMVGFQVGMMMPGRRLVGLAVPIVLSLTSCGNSDGGAGSSGGVIQVTFDGDSCISRSHHSGCKEIG